MIILKHLTVERFRLLRELNLHFPQRGSILIQGPNEAGKSALLESIYFGLYGEPIAPAHHGTRALDDLILYGSKNATVTLTISVGATELIILRTIERGQGQKVVLQVQRLGMAAEEPIIDLTEANQRIIHELGCMDGETLRNSCLIEQKGLAHLEALHGAQRETAARKLLGLEQLAQLSARFTLQPEDEQHLTEANEYLRLAEIQQRIPELSKELEEKETALDAVAVHEHLADSAQQEEEIVEQEQVQAAIQEKRLELKNRQSRAQQLQRADATLEEIIAAYDEIAEAQREMPELEVQIEELEHREQEELPILQKRVNDLAELTQSFGTLQRMSNDLLTAIDVNKELEQELKQHEAVRDELRGFDDQIAQARARMNEAEQALNDLQEQRRSGRPSVVSRLERMQNLHERLQELGKLEERYSRRVASRTQAEENRSKLERINTDLRASEHEASLVEAEFKQVQQRADAVEQRWRQLSIHQRMQEWYRLAGLVQGLRQAEQRVHMAYQQQGVSNQSKMDAHSKASHITLLATASTTIGILALVLAIILFAFGSSIGWVLILLAILAGVFAVYNFHNAGKARELEQGTDTQLQDATNRLSMAIAAREAAQHAGADPEALQQIEHDISSLGGTIPQSLEEAQHVLEQIPDRSESMAELQQKVKEKRDEANAARDQANASMEAVANLRAERLQLEGLRKQGDWNNIEANLHADQAALERMHQEITLLAGQEGLPTPSIDARLRSSADFETYASGQLLRPPTDEDAGVPDLDALVESSIKIAERELATLDEKLNLTDDLENQVKIHQGALDVLLTRRHIVEERDAAYQAANPALQVERAHEQQTALSQALQALRESLHQRVKPLGVMFGQTAISSAETSARKQLESLQILLGGKLMLQEKHETYMVNLKERQASLSGLYKQLAKYSNSLGSWIVPLNPFSGQLVALRARCHDELQEANEEVIQKELAGLESQEGASKAKIALCRQDIETAQEHIASLLVQRKRPVTKNFALADLVAIWPLLSEYAVADQQRLEEERDALEKEMSSLEEQEMELSKRLNAPETPLDLEQMRARKEEQERSYLVKKHGNRLIEAIDQRLLRKMQPRIEHYMQQILPLLTSGRYHDVHLTTENEEGTASGGPFQIEVWDSAAGEYVSKSALSGGAADQLSLALRLAFAIAALPRELNVAPGFVLLDEPLSSFDLGRAQALANVVTGDVLCQHFEQIILISHSSAFDPALFPYHLYLDSGMIVESNLPIVLEPSVSETETLLDVDAHLQTVAQQDEPQEAPVTDDVEEDEEDLLTVHVPAITSFVRKGTK